MLGLRWIAVGALLTGAMLFVGGYAVATGRVGAMLLSLLLGNAGYVCLRQGLPPE